MLRMISNVLLIQIDEKDINCQMADHLLKRGVFDDYIFENVPVLLCMTDVDTLSILYRLLYETVYMRYPKTSRYVSRNRIILRMTLSEALGYIYEATPPIFSEGMKKDIKERGVVAVREMLLTLLVDKSNTNHQYYISLFKKRVHLERFDTRDTIPQELYKDKFNKMRSLHPNDQAVYVITYMSTSLKSLMENDSVDDDNYDKVSVHLGCEIFGMPEEDLMQKLNDLVMGGARITNVYKDASNAIRVSIYIPHLTQIGFDIIHDAYLPFTGKK